jgi:RNA recognition motif-containing protein
MWPRTDASVGPGADMTNSRRTKSTGLSGFVSYMRRKDAEQALRELDGFDWGGSILRVGWSKAVPIAQKPMYSKKFHLRHFPLFHICSIGFGQKLGSCTATAPQSFPVSCARKTSWTFFPTLSQSMGPKPLRVPWQAISLSTS